MLAASRRPREMRAVLIVGLVLVAAQVHGRAIRWRRSALEPEAKECVEELALDAEEIQGLQSLIYAPETHTNYTLFMDCYWKKIGYLDEQGALQHDYVKQMIGELLQEHFDPDTSTSISGLVMSKCRDIDGDSHGLKAVRIGNCIMKNVREILIALLT